jgi:hypothetical protein
MEANDPLRDNAAMTLDEATVDVRGARRLAGAALIIYGRGLVPPTLGESGSLP